MPPPRPTQLARDGDTAILILWSDGHRRRYTLRELRDACPCANCKEKAGALPRPASLLPVLSPQELQPLRLTGMRPLGNYAYNLAFSDGHDTGIYTFDLLRSLGSEAAG